MVNWVSFRICFFLSAPSDATYIFTGPTCTITIITLEPYLVHLMLSFSISYWELIKFPCFADTTERGDRGWKQAQSQGDFMDNSLCGWISLVTWTLCVQGSLFFGQFCGQTIGKFWKVLLFKCKFALFLYFWEIFANCPIHKIIKKLQSRPQGVGKQGFSFLQFHEVV